MNIFLFITLWVVMGFIGTYIGHKYIDDSRLDTSIGTVIGWSLSGAIVFTGAILVLTAKVISSTKLSEILSRPLFKAKK